MISLKEDIITGWNAGINDQIHITFFSTEQEESLKLESFCDELTKLTPRVHVKKQNDENHPIPVHNLNRLAEECSIDNDLSDKQKQFLDNLNPFYIKARYPNYKQKQFEISSKEYAEEVIQDTKDFVKWLKLKLQ